MSESGVEQVEVDEEAIELEVLKETKVFILSGEENTERECSALKKCQVVLNKVRLNEIRVAIPEKTKRKISYKEFDGGEGGKSTALRIETITALERDYSISSSEERNVEVLLQISSEFNTIFNIRGFKDDANSILDVLTGQAMSTMVLDAFLSFRLHAFNRNRKENNPSPTYELLSVHFLPIYDAKQSRSTFKPNLHLLPTFPLKDCILLAPLYLCKHFYLAIFNFINKTVYVYDSYWKHLSMFYRFHQVRKILKSLVGTMLTSEENEDSWKVYLMQKCAQQEDTINCGCYVIYFIENELNGKTSLNKKKMDAAALAQIRQEIVKRILPSTPTGSKLLDAILA